MKDAAGISLNCTANDVSVAFADNIRGIDGQPLAQCIDGTRFSFVADFHVKLTAQTRFDVGMYFATDGDPNHDGALTGACGVNVITSANSPNFVQLDPAPDTCGDIDSAHNPQVVTVQIDNVLCTADAGGNLSLPDCTSWRQPGSNGVCSGPADAFPGSPSKCNCDTGFTVPIHVAPPTATAVKSVTQLLCSDVQYGFSVTNTSPSQQSVTLTSLMDSTYGDLFTVGHDGILRTDCVAVPIAFSASASCTFDAHFCGGTETDMITATLDDGQGGVITAVTNTLTVISSATAQ